MTGFVRDGWSIATARTLTVYHHVAVDLSEGAEFRLGENEDTTMEACCFTHRSPVMQWRNQGNS